MKSSNLINLLNKCKWLGIRKLFWLLKNFVIYINDVTIDLGIKKMYLNESLIKRPISRKLINDYGGDDGQNLNYTQFFLGFGLIHYAFVRNIKPKNILCIGSLKGFVPAILSLACKDNGMGHVDFIDAGYDQTNHEKHWSGIGFWKNQNAKKHFTKIGVERFIKIYVMTTKEYSLKFPPKKYQYIYIDGDHSYEGAKLDYDLFWPMLEKYGFMSFHDIIVKGHLDKGIFGVWKLWKEIMKKNKKAIIFPFPKNSGLGIIQKI